MGKNAVDSFCVAKEGRSAGEYEAETGSPGPGEVTEVVGYQKWCADHVRDQAGFFLSGASTIRPASVPSFHHRLSVCVI